MNGKTSSQIYAGRFNEKYRNIIVKCAGISPVWINSEN
jgi:hypothetical protein